MLASKHYGTIYIGVTSDLIARIYQHRTKAARGFTSRYSVYRLVRFEQFADMHAAISREKQLKNWHRPWKINLIEENNPEWLDLAIDLGLISIEAATNLLTKLPEDLEIILTGTNPHAAIVELAA